jgi:SAM-dependent methyltransferase
VIPEQPIEDLLARLERERLEADRRYNDALTALDAALRPAPLIPETVPPYDASRLPEVNAAWETLPGGVPQFDASIKGRIGRMVWRLVGPSLEAQRRFNAAVTEHLNRNASAHDARARALATVVNTVRDEMQALVRFQALLVQYLQTITAYVDTKDRSGGGPEIRERLSLIEQRLRTLTRASALTPPVASGAPSSSQAAPGADPAIAAPAAGSRSRGSDAFAGTVDSITYLAFEDQFRGSTQEIRARVQDYVPIFTGASGVVDIGCGRGELLAAFRDAGISARGVDVSPAMVEVCRAGGFDVELGDAVSYVSRQEDSSLGGLVAIQVVEHFAVSDLTRFLEAAHRAMRPGAAIVLETINPACWMAFFETYIRDPTHEHPLHPETLRHLVRAAGFTSVDLQYRSPVASADRLREPAAAAAAAADPLLRGLIESVHDHATKLNSRLFSFMDYAVIARR